MTHSIYLMSLLCFDASIEFCFLLFFLYMFCRTRLHKYMFFSRYLASGSGDTTVRFWDVNTETPQFTCKG